MSDTNVRVRFAPSPTGPLHIGGVRTALFNYLFAKKHGGKFILRIEDTDQTRFVPGAEDYIMESLGWCGLTIDEGIREGGEFGPYRQSERKHLYKQYSDQLIANGNAYIAFDTPEELNNIRSEFEARKETFTYNNATRTNMRNSLVMDADEVKSLIDAGTPHVVRFKMPDNVDVTDTDIIRGEVTFNSDRLDDKILFKSDGMPTYHLANVVDDHLMEISHVIRGEEWLPSMPLHVLLYQAFGWNKPKFAHLPLILKPVGKGKLGKRDGDKLGFPVFPLLWTNPANGEITRGYREDGYFAEAFVNMLAFLGWNPGTEQEIFSIEELAEVFTLERVNKAGAKFDPEKTKWYNNQYLQKKSNDELAVLFKAFLEVKGIEKDLDYISNVVGLVKERATFIPDLWVQSSFFFENPTEYDPKVVKKRWKEGVPEIMKEIYDFLFVYNGDWKADEIKPAFSDFVNEKGWGFGVVMNAFRLCLVGAGIGPDLFLICETIGKKATLLRINNAIENI